MRKLEKIGYLLLSIFRFLRKIVFEQSKHKEQKHVRIAIATANSNGQISKIVKQTNTEKGMNVQFKTNIRTE